MKKFRVKPGEVEAEQYFFVGNPNPREDVSQKLLMINGVPTMRNLLETPAGPVIVHEGDWIIKYQDNLGVMSNEDFEENYEPI